MKKCEFLVNTHTRLRGQHSAPESGEVIVGQDPPSSPLPAKKMSANLLLLQQYSNGQQHPPSDLLQLGNTSRSAGEADQLGARTSLHKPSAHSVVRFLIHFSEPTEPMSD